MAASGSYRQCSQGPTPSAEPEALKHLFSYLVNSIDTAALLPAALSRDLITDRQREECSNETDRYKKAEKFLTYLLRAVNADYYNYHTFILMLRDTNQLQIASRLRDELTHSIRSMQQPSASSSTDEESSVVVPEALVEELTDLRFAFAKLLRNYEKQLHNSPEAQEEFVAFLPRLFRRAVEDHSFRSHFNTLVEEEVSLFNTHYLKRLCSIFPEDVCAATRQLVDEYEQQRQRFMSGATVSQFKQLFPATATPSKLSSGKVSFTLKLVNDWGSDTLQDLTKLVINFGVSGSAFHLSKVEDGCIAVTWLCSTSEVKQLKMAILEATGSLQTMRVLQVFIGEEELVLECSATAPAAVKQLEGPRGKDQGKEMNDRFQEGGKMIKTLYSELEAWLITRKFTIDKLMELKESAKKNRRARKISSVAGGAGVMVGTALGALGIGLSFVTLGAGLVLLVPGAVISGAGAVTIAGAGVGSMVVSRSHMETAERAIQQDRESYATVRKHAEKLKKNVEKFAKDYPSLPKEYILEKMWSIAFRGGQMLTSYKIIGEFSELGQAISQEGSLAAGDRITSADQKNLFGGLSIDGLALIIEELEVHSNKIKIEFGLATILTDQ